VKGPRGRGRPVRVRAFSILPMMCAFGLGTAVVVAEVSDPRPLARIAFGSCADQNKDQAIWEAVLAARPDLFIFAGDNIYGDTVDMQVMLAKYAKLAAQPGYQKLLEACPVLSTWDDHDFGLNDGGASYPKRNESARIHLDFFKVAADSPRRLREGIYGSQRFGPAGQQVQVILLDTRFFKSAALKDGRDAAQKTRLNLVGWYVANPDPASTILGEAQWQWLEDQLRLPAQWRLIVSSTQVIADEKGMESWGNFPHERKRLYEVIRRSGAEGVVILSGDVHFAEISRTDDGPYPLFDFTSSGLSKVHPGWAAATNNHRVSPSAYAKPNFGLLEIDWNPKNPSISMQARGLSGEVAFELKVMLAALRAGRAKP
jgi:alkaline phosphatase D